MQLVMVHLSSGYGRFAEPTALRFKRLVVSMRLMFQFGIRKIQTLDLIVPCPNIADSDAFRWLGVGGTSIIKI
jgi:hypothetical protein